MKSSMNSWEKGLIGMNKKILEIFKSYGMKYFWGNYFDSRFYIGYLISKTVSNNILDIGCGIGVLSHVSNAKNKVGIDISFESLQIAKQLDPSIEFVVGDVTKLPFRHNYFEKVLAVHILTELSNMDRDWKPAFDEILRVSKERSEIIFAGNNRRSNYFKHRSKESIMKYITHDQQYELLKNDFKIESFGYDPYSKIIMYPLKKILFSIPDSIAENLGLEKLLFWILRSKRFLKNGRSYVIKCRKKS